MRRVFSLLLVGSVALIGTAGADDAKKDSREAVIKDVLKALGSMADTFDTIKDGDTAKKAKPKLDKLADSFEKIATRAKKLGKPNAEENAALKKKYEPQLKKTAQRFVQSAVRLASIPEAQGVLKEFSAKMKKIGEARKAIGQ